MVFRNQDADPNDEKDWDNQHEWLVDVLEKLYAVFHPRLTSFSVEDKIVGASEEEKRFLQISMESFR